MIAQPEFAVVVAPGTNCKDETVQALEFSGATVRQIHVADWKSGDETIASSQGLILPGGFSYGDIIRAGVIFARDLMPSIREDGAIDRRATDEINAFAAAGKPIIGTCNGFQVLVETGLLPHGRIDSVDERLFTLDANANPKFEDRWVKVWIENSICQFLLEEDQDTVIELPVAHAEGRFIARDLASYEALIRAGQVVLRYCDDLGKPTEDYPANPNGSPFGIAGICSPSGTVFGMMPHDERFARREHHPNWRRSEVMVADEFLAKILRGSISYAKEM